MSLVTIAVPVFNGARHLPSLLASIRAQSFRAFSILLCVDRSSDDSLEFCRMVAHDDARVTVVEHKRRVGFQQNVDTLIRHVDTEYFCILPQDDEIDACYIDELLAALQAQPHAALAYADMDRGEGSGVEFQAPLCGSRDERLLLYLARQVNHVEWRGLVRRSRLAPGFRFRDGDVIDHRLPLVLAAGGDLIRVPKTLYHKRMVARSATAHQVASVHGRLERWLGSLESSVGIYDDVLELTDSDDARDLSKFALLLRMLHVMEINWPLHALNDWVENASPYFGTIFGGRARLVLTAFDALDELRRRFYNWPTVIDAIEGGVFLHLALLAECTGDRIGAGFLARAGMSRVPGMAALDEFHQSVCIRLTSR